MPHESLPSLPTEELEVALVAEEIDDGFVTLDGEDYYCISRVDERPPFLVSVVSDGDLWMYVSSYGGLTAGRVDEDHALFPYETDDRLHRLHGISGPYTLMRVRRNGAPPITWEPLTSLRDSTAQRHLYKSVVGNRLMFEERHADLGLTFRYRWAPSDGLGFVRTVSLVNDDPETAVEIALLDGLLNLLPPSANVGLQQRSSCLIDAYMRCEVDPTSGMGIFAMQAQISDRPEPVEALTANVVWSSGLPDPTVLLSTDQVTAFRAGHALCPERLLTGRRGAYLVGASFVLAPGATQDWVMAADVDCDQPAVEARRAMLAQPQRLDALCAGREAASRAELVRAVAAADGLQLTGNPMSGPHQFANALFNIMRGGIFVDNYLAPAHDIRRFMRQRGPAVAERHAAWLAALDGNVSVPALIGEAGTMGDPSLLRLCFEYLPLTFSRRHGDPSRPWNRFAIHTRNRDGSRVLAYQGNWRDIFQNWEATCVSFPGFLDSVIARFVNASTVDGFNPYRMTHEGFEWETPDEHDPWSNIGYWGDHQIIYLLKLLEASAATRPGRLSELLTRRCYAYGDVPYRLKPYAEMLADSKHTIVYDSTWARQIAARQATMGADGALLPDGQGAIHHVTLLEKLLVPVLSKLGSLVLDGGIWMNTQRPEWNDANNALVGNGLSMVTLCYLRRYLRFLDGLLTDMPGETPISAEVATWYDRTLAILDAHTGLLEVPAVSDRDRKAVLDALGQAFTTYREGVYGRGFSGMTTRTVASFRQLCQTAMPYLDHAIRANRRADGLYHAYNLLYLTPDGQGAAVEHLYEMLEGQVAVLSSGVLTADEAVDLLDALRASAMYREDQDSYMLYPKRTLPGFLERNLIPDAVVASTPLLRALIEAGDRTLVIRDVAGQARFDAGVVNDGALTVALDALGADPQWTDAVATGREAVREAYETVFHHRAFTGRSGTMYGYEGLGCIYWHMVAKLMLAVQEGCREAAETGADPAAQRRLAAHYYAVRGGLGFNKTARVYGAFPQDPYSHTPAHTGAKQPGMTGQVKEELLARWGELGVVIGDGQIRFRPTLLRAEEFLADARPWSYYGIDGAAEIVLPSDALGFTLCQTPVVYTLTDGPARVAVSLDDAHTITLDGDCLPADLSAQVFGRTGRVQRIDVTVPRGALLD